MVLVDDYSRHVWVRLLKKKSDAFGAFRDWLALVENETGQKLSIFRDDKGGEYTGKQWDALLAERGIRHETTARASPSQNGVSERFMRKLEEGIISMLQEAGLPPSFWDEALPYLARVLNATPTSAVRDATPFEAWTGEKPDVSAFRVFGCRAYSMVLKDKRDSLLSTEKCRYSG
jgi:transposase InsO family protein